ncbi:unnamed protein product [Danaus chrysippus]|uniref:(African queen) hypothetical protein n=1 Tax=Danaus chrysippus TaxID=151541 RepID=A0A8J2QM81_9NEOP|nr:unnamed protein product [Danaus chrysippus]
MKAFLIFVAVSVLQKTRAEDGFLPSYIHPCSIADPKFSDCVKEQIVECLPHFTKGIPEYGVPSIDPVDLNDIIIDGNGLKLKFTDAQMHGLSKIDLTGFNLKLGDNEESFELKVKGNLSLTAQYTADGQILILPIRGHGDALIDCDGIEVQIKSNLSHVKDDKGTHFKLVAPNYKYDITNTKIDLKNLFDGNKQLAETTLKFANENWRQLMDDLAPPAIKQIVKTIVKNINKFFSKVTIQQIIHGYQEKQ